MSGSVFPREHEAIGEMAARKKVEDSEEGRTQVVNSRINLNRWMVVFDRRAARSIAWAFLLALTWSLRVVAAPESASKKPVEVWTDAHRAVISNEFLSLEVSRDGKQAKTTKIRNLRAGKTLDLEGEDFVLEYTDGSASRSSELVCDDIRTEPVAATEKRLVLGFHGGDLRVRLVTELRSDRWWAERWLEIQEAPKPIRRVGLSRWRCDGARGRAGPGSTVATLGYPSGCGQVVYAQDLFVGMAHPGAENFATDGVVSCALPTYGRLTTGKTISTCRLVVGAGEAGDARRAFLAYIDATRAVPARMVFLVNDWYWKDKSKPLDAIQALARVKQASGVPIDSFTLDDGWDFDWDGETKIWGRLNRQRFPGGWDALLAAGRSADINISLWFGPIGGYSYRPRRIEFAKTIGFEINGDKLCLAGPRYHEHVAESFSRWAARGMDYIKVDGFWPNCPKDDHGHPVGPGGAISQMDALRDVFATWREKRPDLLIGYTSGSNPSPFWLQHADYLWRGGRDDSHAGTGPAFDKHNTYLDSILQLHRPTEMPISAFVTFDIVQGRVSGGDDEVFERGCWWLAARTSLHHDWYIQASDLSLERWRILARVAKWARHHEKLFRWSRMVGGDPSRGEIYGFSAYDKGRATLALRNPSSETRTIEGSLDQWLDLPDAARRLSFRPKGVYGHTAALVGVHDAGATLRLELPPLSIAVFEVESILGTD
ncbi:MAG: hypothetical protein AMS16_00530 [Planctomycetes bacterium DG_58]|nr:MAG: hypothetical protein AMS16_00530 [Planctomycetes bacterium DG_58]